ncbi:ATP synthase protein I [Clostridium acetobutylicum]|uniref:Predicted membrane protein in FoF1-type ATP synthase operon n=2 Tax=Clostridium acetobutylicum TaxID=1488 RepID=Q7D458_CLOAB|nr:MULTISPECIES: ATP synthase subunit I [Clostridium]AFA34953.1 putative FoF1-type ATP synthase operon membrane protein [Integration vector pMTL-JH16]AFA34998.1 putative FoF1-type ATP synthase operon membrane protein [Integration vector pMTL-JH31]QVN25280.1 CAC2872 [Shuttle vector pPM64-lacZ]QVN25285.1 CAC2872 [Shuttle vector pPM65-lacZ]AAD16419.1 ATP synthase subunit i [Clostridium acetobutylicum ATCC 824]
MNLNIKRMLKVVTLYDAIIAAIVSVILLFAANYKISLIVIIGIFSAIFNFYLSNLTADFVFVKKMGNTSLIFLSSIFRVILVFFIGIILYKIYKYYLIAYLGGYSAHFIALIIYGSLVNKR